MCSTFQNFDGLNQCRTPQYQHQPERRRYLIITNWTGLKGTAVWQQVCTRSGAKCQVVIIYWCVVCEWESGSLPQLHHQCSLIPSSLKFWTALSETVADCASQALRLLETRTLIFCFCARGVVSGEVFFYSFVHSWRQPWMLTGGTSRPQTFVGRSGEATSTVTFNVSKIKLKKMTCFFFFFLTVHWHQQWEALSITEIVQWE